MSNWSLLLSQDPGSTTEKYDAIDFDAETRLATVSLSRRVFDGTQKCVFAAGLLILLTMLFFPPWLRQEDKATRAFFVTQGRHVTNERFLGYYFLFSRALPADEVEHHGGMPTTIVRKRSVIAFRLLVPQVLLLTVAVAIAIGRVRRPRSDESVDDVAPHLGWRHALVHIVWGLLVGASISASAGVAMTWILRTAFDPDRLSLAFADHLRIIATLSAIAGGLGGSIGGLPDHRPHPQQIIASKSRCDDLPRRRGGRRPHSGPLPSSQRPSDDSHL